MSVSKNHNSIIFLTTLSVYLGLVLVGAAPPVLAQAALTQKIEIQNEAEIKDDLDKKPDDEPCLVLKYNADNLLKNFQLDNSSLEIALSLTEISIGNFLKPETISFSFTRVRSNNDKTIALKGFLTDFNETRFNFGFNDSEINSSFITSYNLNEKAQELSIAYNSSLDYWRCESQEKINEIPTQIYQNTIVSSENNQVFIITNLPRAALDEILANQTAN